MTHFWSTDWIPDPVNTGGTSTDDLVQPSVTAVFQRPEFFAEMEDLDFRVRLSEELVFRLERPAYTMRVSRPEFIAEIC